MSSGFVPYPQPTAPSMPPCYSALDILKIIASEDPMLFRDMVFVMQRHAAKTLDFQTAQMKDCTSRLGLKNEGGMTE